MKDWKKLLLCIAISVLIATFIGATLSVINNRVIVYLVVKEQEKEISSKENLYATLFMQEYLDEEDSEIIQKYINGEEVENRQEDFENKLKNIDIDLNKMESILREDRFRNMARMYGMTAGIGNELYLFSVAIGVVTGILVYLIFVKKSRFKKILLISCIGFIILFLIFNITELATDIRYSIEENHFGIALSDYFSIDQPLIKFFVIYLIILLALYIINLIYQKRVSKKLNQELNQVNK